MDEAVAAPLAREAAWRDPGFDLGSSDGSVSWHPSTGGGPDDGEPGGDPELVAACYETAARALTWRDLLAAFCHRFEAQAGALCRYDFASRRGALQKNFNIPPGLGDRYNSGLFAGNPWLDSPTPYRPLSVIRGEEICASARLVKSDFYRDFLAPQGLFHRLCGVVSRRGSEIQYVSLLRLRSDEPFGLEDKAMLGSLLGYLGRSLQLRGERQRAGRERSDLRGLLARLPIACLLVDRSARLGVRNHAADQLLETASGLALRSGRLIAGSRQDSRRLHGLIRAVADGGGEQTQEHLILPRGDDALPLLCALLPLADDGGEGLDQGCRSVALLVKDMRDLDGTSARDFAAAFGLTAAEARLVALLGAGSALFEAAGQLGITKSTARTHMRNIYGKVGANRQADIVRLLERFALF